MANYEVINGIRVRQEGIGERFGRAVQIGPMWGQRQWSKNGKNKGFFWFAVCECDCGNVFVRRRPLETKSCGCLITESVRNRMTTHGMYNSETYRSWKCMLQRCNLPTNAKYQYYGGRGIRVCDRWSEFENFFADMGQRPEGCSIDRIDPNRNYEPSNCRWATKSMQARNTSATVYMTYRGVTKKMVEFAEELGIKYDTLRKRRAKGWSDDRCLDCPVARERYK